MRISERAARAHPWAPRHLDIVSGRKSLRRSKTKRERSGLHFKVTKYSGLGASQLNLGAAPNQARARRFRPDSVD